MGISEGLPDGAEVDCSAGTIVWVRRRNGSWWPGKILGTEELSSSHLMSPRSGTPVKLLGREDASVDWYNLEKSKRVKAFRCGEFDDCIERAESSQGIPIKKREKYARREDAILHALELERLQIEKKQQKMGITLNHMSEKVGPSENHWGNNDATDYHKYRHLRSPSHSKISDSSFEEAPMVNGLFPQKRKPARQPSWEDNNSEAVPRMRGLQDFGLRIASSKRKIPSSVSLDVNHDHVIPVHVSSNKNSLPIKRKRSQGGPTDEFLVKRRDRRRPLVQVLQSSAKLASCHTMPSSSDTISMSMQGETEKVGVVCRAKRSKCVFLPSQSDDCLNQTEVPAERMQLACPIIEENKSSESSKDEESDSTESDYSDLDVEVEATVLSDPVQMLAVGDPTNSSGSIIKRQPLELEELDEESPLSSYGSQIHSHEQTADISVDVRGSKWQLKGKRNIRNLTKTSVEAQIARYDNRRYSFNMRPSSRDRQRSYHDTTDSDEDSQAGVLVPWEESDEGFNPVYVGRLGSGMDSLLVDVDLKVQASYQGEHVPLVSLMSRLNGKAIIGHPVQVETLEEGSSDHLFSTNVFGEEPLADNDGNAGLPPVWRTARRTAMHRVPHPRPSSALEGKEVYPLQYSDDESKPKPHVGRLNHKVRLMKNYSHAHGLLLEKRPLKKLSKKVSLLSQKTRTLSSIAIEQRSSDSKSANKNGGLIKPEEMAPSIACVPVKLVFSRILEGIGKPPFKAVSKPL